MQMADKTPKKTFKQVCTCENCGNEAEMVITCSLEPDEKASTVHVSQPVEEKSPRKQRPGQATCSHCGNEAEILVDIEYRNTIK
jgi:hypothetical protein